MKMKNILTFTTHIFKEGRQYVSFNPELEVASCGDTPVEAKENLKKAIKGFVSVAREKGTLNSILKQAGFIKEKQSWKDPSFKTIERLPLAV